MSVLQVLVFAFTLWMGLYALSRADDRRGLAYAGLGLLIYAVVLGLVLVAATHDEPLTWQPYLVLASVPCWIMALLHLHRLARDLSRFQRISFFAYIAAVFFLLTIALLLIPQTLFKSADLLVAMSCDIVIMGYVLARMHIRADGEALLPDALRSLVLAAGGGMLFGGQTALIIALQPATPSAQYMLLTVLASVMVIAVFYRPLLRGIERLIHVPDPGLQTTRTALQQTVDELAHADTSIDPLSLSRAEFERITRRALSMMNHPHRLIASPLMQFPLLDQYLQPSGAKAGLLDRAQGLRTMLSDSIQKLKPDADSTPTPTEEWRHYNALYLPYVLGIKPFTLQPLPDDIDAETRHIAEWIRAQVPERTFHNWQNAAAKLIARDLWEQLQHYHSDKS
ncbi:MAG: hypothetical protein U0670_13815 [Anaerolineae bacterium]